MRTSHSSRCLDATVESERKIVGRTRVKVIVSIGYSLQSLTKLSVTYFISAEEVSQSKESESNLSVDLG
jgi:hypothetical protein